MWEKEMQELERGMTITNRNDVTLLNLEEKDIAPDSFYKIDGETLDCRPNLRKWVESALNNAYKKGTETNL